MKLFGVLSLLMSIVAVAFAQQMPDFGRQQQHNDLQLGLLNQLHRREQGFSGDSIFQQRLKRDDDYWSPLL